MSKGSRAAGSKRCGRGRPWLMAGLGGVALALASPVGVGLAAPLRAGAEGPGGAAGPTPATGGPVLAQGRSRDRDGDGVLDRPWMRQQERGPRPQAPARPRVRQPEPVQPRVQERQRVQPQLREQTRPRVREQPRPRVREQSRPRVRERVQPRVRERDRQRVRDDRRRPAYPIWRGPARRVPTHRTRRYRNIVIVRPYGHFYRGYGHYHGDYDAFRWLAFTAITLAVLDLLNESQQRAHEAAQIRATLAPVGETVTWNQGRASGSVVTLRDGTSSSGRYCREFQQTVTVGGRTEQAYGTACQQPDGAWEVVSGGR